MPNKKSSRNAYFFFALDMIPELKRRGLHVSGVREAIPLCSGDWALLTMEQKEKYAEKAKMWKRQGGDPPSPEGASGRGGPEQGASHHSQGASLMEEITEVLARHKQEEARDRARHQMRMLKKSEGLETKVIYFLNIFSHGEMPGICEQRFVPCEIGCVRYTLKEGILNSFHDFIDPGELPLGFRYHCQAGSDSTHKIPVSGFKLANRDYHNLYRLLCDFVCQVPSVHVQVYCMNSDIYRVRWCLQWLACKAGMDNRFELLDIESLIQKFYRDRVDEEPSRSSVKRLLDVGYWDYASNTRCKWHEENDMWYCALASCKKMTYCISKTLAPFYGVTLTSAHLPDLEIQEKQTSNDNKTVIVDASRYQKKDCYFTASLDAAPPAGGETSTLGMRGVVLPAIGQGRGAVPLPISQGRGAVPLPISQGRGAGPIPTSQGRGRAILRMLAEMAPFQPTEE